MSREGKRNRLTATEVARSFSDVLNRVHYRNEVIEVERGGAPVCEIRPAYGHSTFTGTDFATLLRQLPDPGEDYLRSVESAIESQPPAETTKWPR